MGRSKTERARTKKRRRLAPGKGKKKKGTSVTNKALTVLEVFTSCVNAIGRGKLITRESSQDKEFHFQNWFKQRLEETKLNFEQRGRNTYPDFSLVAYQDGYELKGLAYPGRDANFDSNSQTPSGFHNGRNIYYVFGRYPKNPDGNTYPVLDLVICHGDFLNADHEYKHKNKNIKGFGTYGDVMIRDRKMYVVPTPFHLTNGVAHKHTLILPASMAVGAQFDLVGELARIEAHELIVGYTFDLKTNELVPQKIINPSAGKRHTFRAWRVKGTGRDPVTMQSIEAVKRDLEPEPDDEDD